MQQSTAFRFPALCLFAVLALVAATLASQPATETGRVAVWAAPRATSFVRGIDRRPFVEDDDVQHVLSLMAGFPQRFPVSAQSFLRVGAPKDRAAVNVFAILPGVSAERALLMENGASPKASFEFGARLPARSLFAHGDFPGLGELAAKHGVAGVTVALSFDRDALASILPHMDGAVALYCDATTGEVDILTGSEQPVALLIQSSIQAKLQSLRADADSATRQIAALDSLTEVLAARSTLADARAVDTVIVALDLASASVADEHFVKLGQSLAHDAANLASRYGNVLLASVTFPHASLAPTLGERRVVRRADDPAKYPARYTCYADKAECEAETTCTDNGACALYKSQTKGGVTTECWRCACATGYTGEECEFVDMVTSFNLVFFTSLILIVAVVIVAVVMGNVDSGSDTILYKTAVRPAHHAKSS